MTIFFFFIKMIAIVFLIFKLSRFFGPILMTGSGYWIALGVLREAKLKTDLFYCSRFHVIAFG